MFFLQILSHFDTFSCLKQYRYRTGRFLVPVHRYRYTDSRRYRYVYTVIMVIRQYTKEVYSAKRNFLQKINFGLLKKHASETIHIHKIILNSRCFQYFSTFPGVSSLFWIFPVFPDFPGFSRLYEPCSLRHLYHKQWCQIEIVLEPCQIPIHDLLPCKTGRHGGAKASHGQFKACKHRKISCARGL